MGKIILLSTPLGNLGDVTTRTLEALRVGQYFAVEDTRSFKDLLTHLGIHEHKTQVISFHDHSTTEQLNKILDWCKSFDVYVCSEAGSPIVSDPAHPLIVAAIEQGIEITSCPGPSSLILSMELSGLRPIPSTFMGFLPREKGKRKQIMESLLPGTYYFFESPHRVHETLSEWSEIFKESKVAIMREMTKKFESVYRFKASEWGVIKEQVLEKGEFVLGLEVLPSESKTTETLKNEAEELLREGINTKRLSKFLSIILGRSAKEIYAELEDKKPLV